MTEKLLRAGEASSILGIHVLYLYRLVKEGEIVPIRIGKRGLRFRESEIYRWIEAKSGNKINDVSKQVTA